MCVGGSLVVLYFVKVIAPFFFIVDLCIYLYVYSRNWHQQICFQMYWNKIKLPFIQKTVFFQPSPARSLVFHHGIIGDENLFASF